MGSLYGAEPKRKSGIKRFFPIFLILTFIVSIVLLLTKYDLIGSRPEINLLSLKDQKPIDQQTNLPIGKTANLVAVVSNKENSVCRVQALIRQNEQEKVIFESKNEARPFFNKKEVLTQFKYFLDKMNLEEMGFSEGGALLHVLADDCSLFHFRKELVQNILLDFTSPQVQLTSTQHYLNQGGADVVTYTVRGDVSWSGVRVGGHEFKGYRTPSSSEEKGEHFAFFVYSYELLPGTKIEVVAIDEAGNEARSVLTPAKYFPKEFRERIIDIPDSFIEDKVVAIINQTKGLVDKKDNLENFLLVNRDLRKKNANDLIELAKKSEEKFYWKDFFEPLKNAGPMALFADYRVYNYKEKEVDRQVHLGLDLAAVQQYPIPAANSGRVLFADYFGIYGYTVMLDHGHGLMTLYGHMSAIDVHVGDVVTKGQILGKSGETGLAGGDHLHFSMLIQGVQTNPIEFWDQHWIDDHVYLRLNKEFFAPSNQSDQEVN